MKKRRTLRLSVLASAVTVAAGLVPAAASAQENPIKVGVVLELSGRLSLYGEAGRRGIDMATATFGDTAIGGRKVEFVYKDVQSDTQLVITALNELTNVDRVNFIIGPCASPLISAGTPAWQQKKPIWMQFCGIAPRLREAVGDEDNFFHTFPWTYHYHQSVSEALASYLGKGKKAVVVYSDDDFGRGHIDPIKKYYAAAGIEIVGAEAVRVGTTDFNPLLTKFARLNPDMLIAMVEGGDLVSLAKQLYARKFKAYLVGSGAVQFDAFANAVGPEIQEGWIGPTTYTPGVHRPADANYPKLLPAAQDWEDAFRKRYNRDPNLIDVGSYVTTAMLLIAMERAGGDDLEKVRAELTRLNVSTPLGAGQFTKSEDGTKHQAFAKMVTFQRQGGRPIVIYPSDVAEGKLVPPSFGR